MRSSLLARSLGYLGAAAFVFLLLQATGILETLSSAGAGTLPRDGVFTKAAPGAGPKWKELHARYAADITFHDRSEGLQLAFYGDDLVESWRGSSGGIACAACAGIPDVWGRHFGSHYRAQSYGIAGDQTGNLLWRLRKGGRARKKTPALVVVHAGAVDIDAAFAYGGAAYTRAAAPGIVSRLEGCLQLVHGRNPGGRVILLGLLPRALSSSLAEGPAAAGSRITSIAADSGAKTWPSALAEAIVDVNRGLQELADRYPAAQFVDCGLAFLVPGERAGDRVISKDLMPDGRQPSAEGMHRLGLCLDSLVHFLITSPPPLEADMADEADDPTPERPKNLQTSISQEEAAGNAVPQVAAAGPVAAAAATSTSAAAAAAPAAAAAAAAADAIVQPQGATAAV